MSTEFKLTNYHDLLNLSKALIEAKFHPDPENRYISGSPIIARIASEVTDTLIAIDLSHGRHDEAEKWRRWLSDDGKESYKSRVATIAKNDPDFAGKPLEDKRTFVRDLFAPFKCTSADIEEIISMSAQK